MSHFKIKNKFIIRNILDEEKNNNIFFLTEFKLIIKSSEIII